VIPPWIVNILTEHIETLRAREMYDQAVVLMATIPVGSRKEHEGRLRALRSLRRAARIGDAVKPEAAELEEIDLGRAAEYFQRMGVQVVKAG